MIARNHNAPLLSFLTKKVRGYVTRPFPEDEFDFGRVLRMKVAAKVITTDIEDVLKLYEVARCECLSIWHKGEGHAALLSTCTKKVIVVHYRPRERAVLEIQGQAATVHAGGLWSEIDRHFRKRQLQCPVLTDFLDLSVAGTITRGGFGINSIRDGIQGDHVLSLSLVTPDGAMHTWEPPADGFRYTVSGLFTLGCLATVRIRLSRGSEVTFIATFEVRSMENAIDCCRTVLCQGGSFCTQMDVSYFPRRAKLTFRVGAGSLKDSQRLIYLLRGFKPRPAVIDHRPYRDYRWQSHCQVKQWFEKFRSSRRLWLDYVIPVQHAVEFAKRIDSLVQKRGLGSYLECVYSLPVKRLPSCVDLPFAAAPRDQRGAILFGLYFMPLPDDKTFHRIHNELSATMLNSCLESGGKPYQQAAHYLSDLQFHQIYGELYRMYLEFRNKIDPNGILL